MDGGADNHSQKPHRKRQAGSKAEKRKKSQSDNVPTAKQKNPKAFAFHSVNKVARQVRRTLDVKEKKHHIPVVDRVSAEPPPVLVAVVGPPKVGKSTLVRCLVRNFTRQKVTNVKGPITVVSAKKKRITFIECNNDINSMIDLAKSADLVLLMIDASFDYEMETLEFINICQVHGFPKIIGVLTHLDLFKDKKKLRKKKKSLKDRFWKEVYQGAKLFYLSGMINGEYQKTEVHNLGRFISVMKFRPMIWRSNHPYILADRLEDVTDPDTVRKSPKCDRTVCLYGYIRGCHYRNRTHVHIPGCGDFSVHDMSLLQDPCPLPDQIKKRSLNEKERLIYAPMSGVGGIVYDKDAIYIELGGSHALKDKKTASARPLSKMVDAMLSSQKTIDEKMASAPFQMFSEAKSEELESDAESEGESESGEDEQGSSEGSSDDSDAGDEPARKKRRQNQRDSSSEVDDDIDGTSDGSQSDNDEDASENSDNDDSDDDVEQSGDEDDENDAADDSDDEISGDVRWKAHLAEKASEAFFRRMQSKPNLSKLVYGVPEDDVKEPPRGNVKTVGGVFQVVEPSVADTDGLNGIDCCLSSSNAETLEWDVEKVIASIRDCFVTGKWDDKENASKLLADDDEFSGGFVDLETGEVHGEKDSNSGSDKDESDDASESDAGSDKEEVSKETPQERRQRRMKEKLERTKLRKKAMFDMEYDDKGDSEKKTYFEEWKSDMEKQAKLNRAEFEGLSDEARIQYEGFRPGLYVRVQINDVPAEFVNNFDPTYPVILGGLLPAEQTVGYVTVRLKHHRWYSRKLKTRDPLIISLGWRRFQTVVTYSMQDHNGRHRYLKYTPDHLHCHASFWGPITPQGTGMLGIQTVASNTPIFRIAVTGAVCELDKSITIVKKLKLEGTPYKIYKNTAFIQGMFNTSLEVAKFEGSLLQTVSKIRGQVKKAVREGAQGSFRATFEDKIQLSDIVFLKTWIPVEIPQFYNPVTSLLLPVGSKDLWQGMKTVGELKREKGIRNEVNADHLYKAIVRQPRVFAPLVIPRELQKALPFAEKPKAPRPVKDLVQKERVAIVREPKEREVAKMMNRLKVLYEHKRKQERVAMRERAAEHQKKMSKIEASKAVKRKERAKHAFFLLGQAEKNSKERKGS